MFYLRLSVYPLAVITSKLAEKQEIGRGIMAMLGWLESHVRAPDPSPSSCASDSRFLECAPREAAGDSTWLWIPTAHVEFQMHTLHLAQGEIYLLF